MVTAKTPWEDQMGDMPMHLHYFQKYKYMQKSVNLFLPLSLNLIDEVNLQLHYVD